MILEIVALQYALFVMLALGLFFFASAHRRARAALRHQHGVAEALSGDPNEAVLVLDPEGWVEKANETAERMLGWTRAELLGGGLHQRMHPHPQFDCVDDPATECPLRVLTQPEAQVVSQHVSLKRKDGSPLHLSAMASAILDRGKNRGTVLTLRDLTEHKQQVDALQEREQRYRSIVESSPDAMLLTDLYGYVITANRRAAEMYRYETADQMVGIRAVELFAPDDRKRVLEDNKRALEAGSVRDVEYQARGGDGKTFPADISTTPILDESGQPRAVVYVGRDASERRKSEESFRWSESRAGLQHAANAVLAVSTTAGEAIYNLLQTVCETAEWEVGIFWTVDSREDVLRCSAVWHTPSVEMTGFGGVTQRLSIRRGDDLPGRVWEQSAPVWVSDVVSDAHFPRALMASREGLHVGLCVPVRVRGSVHGVMEFFGRDAREANEDLTEAITAVAVQFGQFVERKHAEKALEYQALHDPLTDLPNRTLLLDRLQRALHAARGSNRTLALLLMDLDRFKGVNDTFGHHYGDLLLKQVGARLQHVVRESDTVARLGGDEFALVLPATDEVSAILVAGKVLEVLERAYKVEGQSLEVGASIGIALYPAHGEDATSLMQHADVAMYMAKRSKAGYAVYASEEDRNSASRLTLTADLQHAIERGELSLHYQPKVDFQTREIQSVEALARWDHPEHGLIPPEEFIPLAEQSGLIKQLDCQVLREALAQCRAWRGAGLDLAVAVNLSAQNLHDPQIASAISDLLVEHNADPSRLVLEVTEAAIMVDPVRARETLARLHDSGVRISIDDFGSGYSSPAYVKGLRVDEINIDRSFVTDMPAQEDDAFIARLVIELGHNLGLKVVAEGVEEETIWGMLGDMGCDFAQGLYVSEPLPAPDLLVWVARWRALEPNPARRRNLGALNEPGA